MKIILDVIENTGITATAGIGTNLYLCKVAMDILAKHIPADENGVRIAELDEMTHRQTMLSHQPLTDFWRVGRGYAKKLEAHGMFTMGDVARMSVCNEDLLCLLYTSDAADEEDSVDLGGRRILKKKKENKVHPVSYTPPKRAVIAKKAV